MRTFSHFLITAIGQQQLKQRRNRVHTVGVLLGSVLPDLPSFLLMASYGIYYLWIAPIPQAEVLRLLCEELYFTDPVWIVGHNLFHRPVLIGLMLLLGFYGLHSQRRWSAFLFWFALGNSFHTLTDVLTHHSDGPLLLFPFNWELRFHSPISYWDPHYYGRFFTVFEYLVDSAIFFYFSARWVRRSAKHKYALPLEQGQYEHERA